MLCSGLTVMSPSVLVAVVLLAGCVAARPSDEWIPSRTAAFQSRAFGASRRSYSAAPASNSVVSPRAPAKEVAVEDVGAPEARAAQNEVEDEGWLSWLPTAEMRVVGKVWDDCAERDDMTGCLKGKALTFLDRAARKDSLALPGGLQLVRTDKDAAAATAPVSDADLEAQLPRDLSARDQKLDQMLLERVLGFVQSHALRFNLADQGAGDGKSTGNQKESKMSLSRVKIPQAKKFDFDSGNMYRTLEKVHTVHGVYISYRVIFLPNLLYFT